MAGLVIAFVVGIVTGNPECGLFAATVAGIGKEAIWDGLMGRGIVEAMDAVQTISGGIVCFGLLSLFL